MLKTMQTDAVMQAILKARSERIAQGFTAQYDDEERDDASLLMCVGTLVSRAWLNARDEGRYGDVDRRANLVEAAALIVAELERMERAEAKAEGGPSVRTEDEPRLGLATTEELRREIATRDELWGPDHNPQYRTVDGNPERAEAKPAIGNGELDAGLNVTDPDKRGFKPD